MNDALLGGINRAAVETQLQKIINSQTFAGSDRSIRFLEFVVTKHLAEDKGALKGDVVAIEVFQKGGQFNPRIDSTVRTGANRHRRMLGRYYEAEGRPDPIIISLPEGRYIPEFRERPHDFTSTSSTQICRTDHQNLVGRGAEIRFLEGELELTQLGQGHLVCVVAEPGVGKTALIEAFLKGSQRTISMQIGTGRCRLQLQSGNPYQVWLDILSDLSKSSAATKDLLHTAAGTWWKQIHANDPGEASVFRLQREMEAFLTHRVKTGPIVLFIDDLHWADIATIDLLNQILPSLRSLRILVVAAYRRSDMMIRQSPFLAIESELEMHGLCCQMTLRHLSLLDVEAYLQDEFPGHTFPPELANSVHEASGGNALCLTEMLRHAVRRGWICRTQSVWRFSALASVWRTELPDSVAAMAAKKLGELHELDRKVLWVSSLQGVVFDSSVTAQSIEMDEGSVADRLDRLRRTHQLLRPAMAPSYAHAGIHYEFAHVLYYDALQQAISPARLAQFSKRTAEAMISAYGEANESAATILARLLEDAGEPLMAVSFHLRAARRACRLSAFRQAVGLLERAIELIAQTARTTTVTGLELEALTLQSLALSALYGYEHAPLKEIYSRAQGLADDLGDQAASIQTGMALWSFAASSNFETALDIATQLTTRTGGRENPQHLANGRLARGVSLIHTGQMARAVVTLSQAHNSSEQDQSGGLLPSVVVDPKVSILCNLARALWFHGRPDQALRVAHRARAVAREGRHAKTSAYAAAVLADIYHLRRDTDNTLIYSEEALKTAREFELAHEMTWAACFRAWALTERGDPNEGCELGEGLLRRYCGPCRPKFWAHCAWSHGLAGNPTRGLTILAETFRSGQERRETYYDAEVFRLTGELLLLQDANGPSRSAALARFQQAANVSLTQKALSLELRARYSIMQFALRYDTGLVSPAAAELARVIGRFREGLDTRDLVETNELLARSGYPNRR